MFIMKKRNFSLVRHRIWRQSLLDRDGGCIVCGDLNRAAAHHLLPACKRYSEWEYDIDNGVMLCSNHHIWGIDSAHKNPIWFYRWMSVHRPVQLSSALSRLSYEV